VAVFGLGLIGQMSSRIARHKGTRVIAVDFVPEQIERARRNGIEVLDASDQDDIPEALREMTDSQGPDSVIDAVGMEAHGSPTTWLTQQIAGFLPDSAAQRVFEEGGVDRMNVF
jgi:threonine dehydrogenase-like Zn-dependent dehydrogenase